ncbi:MAG: hypothetical protein ACXVBW_12630 [Bdellovibrionota bacterium]
MAFSLYDATVANYLQILGAVGGFLEKSLTFPREGYRSRRNRRDAACI